MRAASRSASSRRPRRDRALHERHRTARIATRARQIRELAVAPSLVDAAFIEHHEVVEQSFRALHLADEREQPAMTEQRTRTARPLATVPLAERVGLFDATGLVQRRDEQPGRAVRGAGAVDGAAVSAVRAGDRPAPSTSQIAKAARHDITPPALAPTLLISAAPVHPNPTVRRPRGDRECGRVPPTSPSPASAPRTS